MASKFSRMLIGIDTTTQTVVVFFDKHTQVLDLSVQDAEALGNELLRQVSFLRMQQSR